MKPQIFPTAVIMLGAPPNWDSKKHGPCEGLPIQQKDGICTSGWKPTFWERIKILFGDLIFVHVASGHTQPPIALTVGLEKNAT